MFLYTATVDLLINRVDIFGKPVALNFNGKNKSKSFIGACFSGLVLAFFIWAFFIFSMDMFKKKNPKTITSQSFHENPAAMAINPDTFAFGFGLQEPETSFHYINETIYTIDVSLNALTREILANGTVSEVWSGIPLETETCTTQHFGKLGEKFATIELDKLYCLKIDQPAIDTLTIEGVFESPVFQYISTTVKACDNKTRPAGSTPCASPETIKYYLGGGYFATYFTNLAIDPKNYNDPTIDYRDSYYTSLPYPYYKELALWLTHLEVKSDVGWLTEDVEYRNFITFEKTVENINFRKDMGSIMTFVVRVDKIKTHYERSYTKISDVFAEVNGLGAAVIVAMAFILQPYSNIKFNESLINELFDIKAPSHSDKKDKKAKKQKNKKQVNSSQKRNSKLSNNNLQVDTEKEHVKKHLAIDIIENSSPNSAINSPSGMLSGSRVPFSLLSKESHLIDLTNNVAQSAQRKEMILSRVPSRRSSLVVEPKKAGGTDNEQILLEIPEPHGVSHPLPVENNEHVITSVDMSTHRNHLLKHRSTIVKPANKILEHYEIRHPTEMDLVLESLILDKKENKNEDVNQPTIGDQSPELRLESQAQPGFYNPREENDENSLQEKAQHLPEKLQKSDYQLNITFWEYLQSYFYKSDELKEKFKLLNEGMRRIEERLDIFKVFKKFREVDKMRLLLFESEQLVLFDSLPKPELDIEKQIQEQADQRKSVDHLRETRFINEQRRNDLITASYRNLKRKHRKTIIDDRILDIYDDIQ